MQKLSYLFNKVLVTSFQELWELQKLKKHETFFNRSSKEIEELDQ